MRLLDRPREFKKAVGLWGPVVLQMGLIFYFSAQPKGSSVLEEFPLSAPVGHLGGYFLLGLFLYRAFNGGLQNWGGAAVAFRSMLVGFLYALSDEFHQLFVPGRTATLVDLGYDLIGLLLAMAAVRLFIYFKGKADLRLR